MLLGTLQQHSVGSLLRAFSAAAPQVAEALTASVTSSKSDGVAESIVVGNETLVRMQERPWSAATHLSAARVSEILPGALPDTIGVVRDAFAVYSKPERPLSSVLKDLGNNQVAVHPSLARPESRMVVDRYVRDQTLGFGGGDYKLVHTAGDLLREVASTGVRACLNVNPPSAQQRPAARQSTNEVFMVAPTAFGFNEQTAADNHFMHAAAAPGESSDLPAQVLQEYCNLHHQLSEVHGVNVHLMQHSLSHGTPDACFPNNWFSTHPAGEAAGGTSESTMVLYPMKCPNRAAERRPELVDLVKSRGYTRVVDFSELEKSEERYFEGTGVLVLDRVHGVAYVALSERADRSIAERWVEALGYKDLVTFHSVDKDGYAVYHTNVMMAVGTGVAVVCGESVTDVAERNRLFDALSQTHEIVDIMTHQMDALCGNVLEVEDRRGLPIMAMSTQAYEAFTPEQKDTMLRHCADLVHARIDTLERVGGGGVRCALAELF